MTRPVAVPGFVCPTCGAPPGRACVKLTNPEEHLKGDRSHDARLALVRETGKRARATWRDVRCRTCDAAPGEQCWAGAAKTKPRPRIEPHLARRLDAS